MARPWKVEEAIFTEIGEVAYVLKGKKEISESDRQLIEKAWQIPAMEEELNRLRVMEEKVLKFCKHREEITPKIKEHGYDCPIGYVLELILCPPDFYDCGGVDEPNCKTCYFTYFGLEDTKK